MPISKPRLFIGSSVEGLQIAHAIQENLDHEAEVTVWPQGVFELSVTAVDSLLRVLEASDFGVFVFSPDDVLFLRGEEHRVVRDNVVFELGLFIGKLGRQRSFVVLPRGQDRLHLPSDLAGLSPADYEANRSDGNLQAALGAACNQIRRVIKQLGPVLAPASVITPLEPRKAVLAGIRSGSEYIARAIGPQGLGMAVSMTAASQIVTKSGGMIVRGIHASGYEERGVQELRDIAKEMDAAMGDGAKLSILLFAAMVERGEAAMESGHLPRDVVEGMRLAVDAAKAAVFAVSVPTASKEDVWRVGSTAAQSGMVATLIVDAMEFVGNTGIITVQEAQVAKPVVERVEGVRIDQGFLSPYFAPEGQDDRVELSDCYVLITTEAIRDFRAFLPLLESVAATNRPLLVIAADVDADALTTLVVNSKRGVLKSVAVRAPASRERQRPVLEDLAVLTGATLITAEVGLAVEGATLSDLGRSRHVIVDRVTTTLIGGAGNPERIDQRAAALRSTLDRATSDFDREQLQERVASLTGGVANILVGGLTQSEIFETKYQFYSGLHSTRKAIESGVVLGGGRAYLTARKALRRIQGRNAAEAAGVEAVFRSLDAPIRALIATARKPEADVLSRIETDPEDKLGFDSVSGTVVELANAGILDPAATVVRALESAFTHARQVLLTNSWESVAQAPATEAV